MTISEETIRILSADSGMAIRRKTDRGPTQITRVALSAWDSPDSWTDCDYAETEDESEAHVIPAPRRWTRLAIKTALAQAGKLAAARQFLSATEIAQGYTAWEALTDCDYIEEGFGGAESWAALLDGAANALGKTRPEIDAFLDSIPTE